MASNEHGNISRAAGIIAFFYLFSSVMGYIREYMLATRFGIGDLLDSYTVAFRVPDLVYNLLILGTLSVSFIPVFVEYHLKDKEEANKIANTILTVLFIGMSVLCLLLYIFTPELTHLIAPGFSGDKFNNTLALTRVFLISPVLFTVASVFYSYLNALKRFVLVSIAPIVYNLGIIFGIVFLYPRFGIIGLGYGVIGGALLQLLIQMFGAMAAGFKIRPNFQVGHQAVKKITRLFIPRIFGITNSQFSLIITAVVGSTLASGTIGAFNIVNNFQTVAVTLFGSSFALAAFPSLAEKFAQREDAEFSHILVRTMVYTLFFVVPISVLLIVLRAQIMRVALGHGKVDWGSTKVLAEMLGIFAVSIFAQSLAPLLSRAFYARHNTVKPVVIGLITLAINAVGSYLFAKPFGGTGLVLGFTIANILNFILLYIYLRRDMHHFDGQYLAYAALKIVTASLLMGIVTYVVLNILGTHMLLNSTIKVFVQGALAGIAGMAVFIAAAVVLRINEAKAAFMLVKRKLFR